MNFIPCRLVNGNGGMAVRLTDSLGAGTRRRRARYQQYVDKELLFGLRPEHMTERRSDAPAESSEFQVLLDVVDR